MKLLQNIKLLRANKSLKSQVSELIYENTELHFKLDAWKSAYFDSRKALLDQVHILEGMVKTREMRIHNLEGQLEKERELNVLPEFKRRCDNCDYVDSNQDDIPCNSCDPANGRHCWKWNGKGYFDET